MHDLLKFIIRPETEMADAGFFVLAAFVGGAAGVLLAYKVSLWVGLPFAFCATLMLHLTWRTPAFSPQTTQKSGRADV
jgi:hypothetical protein